jgi:hypothetical protein
VIRVYWAAEKNWYTGEIIAYNHQTNEHTIKYDDEDTEEINLLELHKWKPAWEFSPFTKEYFPY